LVEEIRDGLYWVTEGAYNTIFLVTDEGVVAVDAPPTIGKNYLKAISEVTDKPITHVIYSHAHIDHIGAAGMFPKNAVIIAQEETAAELLLWFRPYLLKPSQIIILYRLETKPFN
jgi:glyoxylase-like metal-dependent hydrolase (beta-lactamase superfamily II)